MKNRELVVERTQELLEFLYEKFPDINKKKMKKLLTSNRVIVDNKIISQYNYELKKKQKVRLDLNGKVEFLERNKIKLLYEDSEIIVIDKPQGLLTIANDSEKDKTAYKIITDYVRLEDIRARIFIVHRLDRDTSGIIVFSKNYKMKNFLQDSWDKLVLERGYIAVVEGILKKKEDKIITYLKENPKDYMVYSTNDQENGLKAITNYKVVCANEIYSLLKVSLETGRKNQIRVHMYDIGHSIIGDKKYGSRRNPIKRLGLHAYRLVFIHPTSKKKMEFELDVPSKFVSLFRSE